MMARRGAGIQHPKTDHLPGIGAENVPESAGKGARMLPPAVGRYVLAAWFSGHFAQLAMVGRVGTRAKPLSRGQM